MELVRKEDDIGTCLLYKFDEQLFRRSTKNAGEMMVRKESLQMMHQMVWHCYPLQDVVLRLLSKRTLMLQELLVCL